MSVLTIDAVLAQAVDRKDAAACGRIADKLRWQGFTYAQILARVQKERPNVTREDWEDLMLEAEDIEAAS